MSTVDQGVIARARRDGYLTAAKGVREEIKQWMQECVTAHRVFVMVTHDPVTFRGRLTTVTRLSWEASHLPRDIADRARRQTEAAAILHSRATARYPTRESGGIEGLSHDEAHTLARQIVGR